MTLRLIRKRLLPGAALVATILCAEGRALASPLFEIAGGVGGQGGFNGRTVEGGAASTYYNPALLTDAEAGLSTGVFVLSEQIGISLAGRPGTQYAVPVGVVNATYANGMPWTSYPIPTAWLQNGRAATATTPALAPRPRQSDGSGHDVFAYQMVGLVTKLFHDRLTLGAYGVIPYSKFTGADAFYSDEREQYFTNSLHPELYADRLTAISIAGGASWKFSDALSVGLGASLSLRAGVGAPTFVSNAGDLAHLLIDTNANVNVSLSPNLGVSFRPSPRWHFTGTVHAPEKVDLDVNFTFLLPSGLQQGSSFPLVYDYMPWQIGAGAAYDIVQSTSDTLTVAASAVYGKWSDYVDRHGDAPVSAYGWYDTLTPTVGLRYDHEATGCSLDAQYKPTPVPLQTGRTNYVDNNRIGFGGGVDYRFSMFHTAMRVGVQAQAYWLVPRHQTKLPTPPEPDGVDHYPALVVDEVPDTAQVGGMPIAGSQGLQTNNPGWPGFGSSGYVLTGGLYLTVLQ
jgi:hypothetical protein